MSAAPAADAAATLAGRSVVVTGANGGIGRAVVEHALAAGASVLATDRMIDSALEELAGAGDLHLMAANLAQDEDVEAVIARAGEIEADGLVNNAAIFDMAPLLESDLAMHDRLFLINVRAMFRIMQGVAGHMVAGKRKGAIVNFASQAGRRGEALVSHYCATKAAVISYTQSAALALAPHKVRVNAVAPGVVDTPMWDQVDALFARYENRQPGEKKRLVGEEVPLGYMGDPAEVADPVVFLLSEQARYITGQTVNIDGGNVLS